MFTQRDLLVSVIADIEPYLSAENLSRLKEMAMCGSTDSLYGPNVFAAYGEIDQTISSYEFRATALVTEFLTKLEPPADALNETANDNGLRKFLDVNLKSLRWSPVFLKGCLGSNDVYDHIRSMVIGEMQLSLFRSLEADDGLNIKNMRKHFDVGPGAINGSNARSFYDKLYGNLTCTTAELRSLYLELISGTPLAVVEEQRCEEFGPCELRPYNALFFVPKRVDIARIAATECGVNAFVQLAIGGCLVDVLRLHFGIDISHQQLVNRLMARIASTTGEFVTLDQSSASDYISVKVCEYLLPSPTYKILSMSRSAKVRIPGDKPRFQKLGMMGTMGNGFTFPLQTLIFTALVFAVYKILEIPLIKSEFGFNEFGDVIVTQVGNYSVFGDDVIIVTKAAPLFNCMLKSLGFQLNEAKSCLSGGFRESCGSDYYYGHNVRSVYLKNLHSLQDKITSFNKVMEWSALHGMPLPRLSKLILDSIPKKDRCYCPRLSEDDAGIRIPEAYVPMRLFRLRKKNTFNPQGLWMWDSYKAEVFGRDSEEKITMGDLNVRHQGKVSVDLIDSRFDTDVPDIVATQVVNGIDCISLSLRLKKRYTRSIKRFQTLLEVMARESPVYDGGVLEMFYYSNDSFVAGYRNDKSVARVPLTVCSWRESASLYLQSILRGNVTNGFMAYRGPSGVPTRYSRVARSHWTWDGGTSICDLDSRRIFCLNLDQRLFLLGRSNTSSFKRLFDILEFDLEG